MKDESRDPQVVLLSVITVLLWFSQYIHVPFQTPYLSGIAVSAGTIGLIIGAYGLTQMLGRVPIGILADLRGQHKIFIVFGMFCTLLASLSRVFFPDGSGYLAANLLSGLASASWVCFIVMYTDLFTRDKLSAATGRIVSLNNFGILLGFLAGMLMRDRLGMRALCLAGAGAALLGTVLSFFLKSGAREGRIPPTRAQISKTLIHPQVWLFAAAALVQQGVVASTTNSFTTQAARELGASGLQIGLCSLIYILSAVISSNFSGMKHLSRFQPSETIPLLFALLTLYCMLVPNLHSVPQLFLAQILAGLSQGWLYATTTAEAMRGIPDSVHSTAMGLYAAVYALGMTVFPIVTGDLAESFGMLWAFYALACVCALSAVLMIFWYVRKRHGRRQKRVQLPCSIERRRKK